MYGGKRLNLDDTKKVVNLYIKEMDIKSKVKVIYKKDMVARATTSHDFQTNTTKVLLKLPVTFRENFIEGILNHEIGTHFIRRHNERR